MDLSDLVPHQAPMSLLDRVVTVEGDRIVCEATVREDCPYLTGGSIPAVVSVEYIAQAVAAMVGWRKRQAQQEPELGMLVSMSQLRLSRDRLELGSRLTVEAQLEWREGPMGRFSGRVVGTQEELASVTLTVYAESASELTQV